MARDDPDDEFATAVAVACGILISICSTSVMVALVWSVLNGPDECEGDMYTYMRAVGITYATELALVVSESILLLLSTMMPSLRAFAGMSSMITVVLMNIACVLISIAWIIWGIVLLANDECRGTDYYTYTVVIVVLSGIIVLLNVSYPFRS
jgi:hypothetical protein